MLKELLLDKLLGKDEVSKFASCGYKPVRMMPTNLVAEEHVATNICECLILMSTPSSGFD